MASVDWWTLWSREGGVAQWSAEQFSGSCRSWGIPSRSSTHPFPLFTSYPSFPSPQHSPWTLLGERVVAGRPGEL